MAKSKPTKEKTKTGKNPGGRPTKYTKELGEKICKAIENTPRGLRWICDNNPDFPIDETIREWLRNETFPGFSVSYARARESQSELLADEVVDVAYEAIPDRNGRVEKERLQVDALKWKAAKLKPKKYGDKPELFLDPKGDNPVINNTETIAEKVSRISDLINKKALIENK